MDKNQKRRLRDAKRTVENNRNKFIVRYIEGLHGDVYVEAQERYEEIKRKNPGRNDLTKTVDFMSMAMPYKQVPLYYYTRRNKQKSHRRSTSTTTMVLNIPLIPNTDIPSAIIPQPGDDDTETSVQEDQEIPSAIIPQPGDDDTETSVQEDQEIPSTTTLPIPDRVYEGLLQEIMQDPDLYRIFNDFNPNPLDNDDTCIQENVEIWHEDNDTNTDMWDAFQDQTPLERELTEQGY